MPFPDVPRVIYEKNSLDEVICQLRFPQILKIDAESPVAFQESIRSEYPFYKSKPNPMLANGLPLEFADFLSKNLPPGSTQAAHEFKSRDEKWILSLTRDFLALACQSYDRWENFKQHLQKPMEALQRIYEPTFYTRIGLRYRNLIRRSELGLAGVPWAELLKPPIAGELASEIASEVDHCARELVLRLPNAKGLLRVHHGFVTDERNKENCYLIDADFFAEHQTEPNDVIAQLDFFNKQSRLLFRWSIQDQLHQTLRPSSL
jgi:uncharacterized protein (TIGR04255 family)